MASNDGFLGAQSMWIGIGVLAVLYFGWRALGPQPETQQEPVAQLNVGSGADARVEKLTRAQCLGLEDRVWAVMSDGVECIAYAASPNIQGASAALLYFSGDVQEDQLSGSTQEEARKNNQRRASGLAAQRGVPVVIVGRPGLMGSSGFHLLGGPRDEGPVINAAVDALKDRLGIRRLALAGQSGGSRIIAQLLVIGRRDIACAAMGAGAYDVPRLRGGGTTRTSIFGDPGSGYLVPMLKAGEIPSVPSRRSFVIGDPRDKVAPFSEQKAWADKLAALGHHVQLIEAKAKDPEFHGMSEKAITAAAMCLSDRPDAEIRSAVENG